MNNSGLTCLCYGRRAPVLRAAVLGAALGFCACSIADEIVRLEPGMSRVAVDGVARLNVSRASIPDADGADPGLHLLPSAPHQWVGAPGKPFAVQVKTDPGKPGRLAFTVWDWELRPVFVRWWTAPHSGTVSFHVAGRGTYLLTLDRVADGRTVARLVRSVSICPSNAKRRAAWRKNGEFFLGTCAYPERMHWRNKFGKRYPGDMTIGQAREKEAALAGRLGLQVVRLSVTADSSWAVDLYEKHGLRLFAKVGQASKLGTELLPRYNHVTEARWRYPMPEELCRPHYAAVARRFGSRAVFFEIGNESDNNDFWRGTAAEFIANAHWAAEGFSRHAPGVPVCVSGWTFIKPDFTREFVMAFRDLFPWASVHAHGSFRRCVKQLARFESLLREVNAQSKTRVDSEMGFSHWRLDMDAASAGYAMRKILYHWAKGYRGVVTYSLRDSGGPRLAGDAKGMWGMLDHDFCPRFKYGALAALIDRFAGYRFDRALVEGPDCYAYTFTEGVRHLVVVFAPDIAWSRKKLGVLRTSTARAARIDPMGNEFPIETPARITVESGIYPEILRLEDGVPVGFDPAPAVP